MFSAATSSSNSVGALAAASFLRLTAALEGRFTIPTVYRCHNELRLNYRCQPRGWIKVELLDKTPHLMTPDGDPAPGFSFAECDPLIWRCSRPRCDVEGAAGYQRHRRDRRYPYPDVPSKTFAYRV